MLTCKYHRSSFLYLFSLFSVGYYRQMYKCMLAISQHKLKWFLTQEGNLIPLFNMYRKYNVLLIHVNNKSIDFI